MVMDVGDRVMPATRVRGDMLADMTGKLVCLVGRASNPSNDGTSFDLKTSDDHLVQVRLSEPLNTYVDGLVEVVGSISSDKSLNCQEYIVFSEEQTKCFDFAQYNAAVEALNKFPQYYPLVEEQSM